MYFMAISLGVFKFFNPRLLKKGNHVLNNLRSQTRRNVHKRLYQCLAGVNGSGDKSKDDQSEKSNEISSDLEEGPFKDVIENIIPSLVYGDDGQDKCERDFLKCSGGILVNGGLQHMNQPEGISG